MKNENNEYNRNGETTWYGTMILAIITAGVVSTALFSKAGEQLKEKNEETKDTGIETESQTAENEVVAILDKGTLQFTEEGSVEYLVEDESKEEPVTISELDNTVEETTNAVEETTNEVETETIKETESVAEKVTESVAEKVTESETQNINVSVKKTSPKDGYLPLNDGITSIYDLHPEDDLYVRFTDFYISEACFSGYKWTVYGKNYLTDFKGNILVADFQDVRAVDMCSEYFMNNPVIEVLKNDTRYLVRTKDFKVVLAGYDEDFHVNHDNLIISSGHMVEYSKDGRKYLSDIINNYNLVISDYDNISEVRYMKYYDATYGGPDKGVVDPHYIMGTIVDGRGTVRELTKYDSKYLLDNDDFKVILSGYENISDPYYLWCYDINNGGKDKGNGAGYVQEVVKDGVKYLVDANNFNLVLLSNYSNVYEQYGKVIVEYEDGSSKIYSPSELIPEKTTILTETPKELLKQIR